MCDVGFTQGGSNADIVIADAYFKNISEGVDWKLAYEALISDAEIEPLNWDVEGTRRLSPAFILFSANFCNH